MKRPKSRLSTAADVAARWPALSRQRCWELARKNLIPHTRIGASVYYDLDVISDWLRAGGTAPRIMEGEARVGIGSHGSIETHAPTEA